MNIQLSDHFSVKRLLLFALSPICSMIFTSLYSIVDGYFVSNYVGAVPFASLNLVMPFIMLMSGVGFMFGTGGSALVAMYLGKKENERANRYFSLIVYTTLAVGAFLGVLGFSVAPYISRILGATEEMEPYCILYLRINMCGVPFFMLQQLFQTFLIAAEKPKLGFRMTVLAGCMNMLLDFLLVGLLRLGLGGAAWATVLSQMVGGIVPFILFAVNKKWLIHLGKASFELKPLVKACSNGVSEFLSNISMSVIGFLFNHQLLKYAGVNGMAAYGVIMYVSFIFVAVCIGFTMGVSPIVSYNYGAGNREELKSLYKKSMLILLAANIIMFAVAELLSGIMTRLFVGYDAEISAMTVKAMRIYSVSFLIMGFNIFASAFFTALNNGRISAIISVSRTLVLQLIMIFLMPAIMGPDGLWAVGIAVEGLGVLISLFFLLKKGRSYGYK